MRPVQHHTHRRRDSGRNQRKIRRIRQKAKRWNWLKRKEFFDFSLNLPRNLSALDIQHADV
jgi:hypothetical protein